MPSTTTTALLESQQFGGMPQSGNTDVGMTMIPKTPDQIEPRRSTSGTTSSEFQTHDSIEDENRQAISMKALNSQPGVFGLSMYTDVDLSQDTESIPSYTPQGSTPAWPGVDLATPPKRRSSESPYTDNQTVEIGTLSKPSHQDCREPCLNLIGMLEKCPNAWMFRRPYDNSYYCGRDWTNKLSNLATIKRMLNEGSYSTLEDLVVDLHLMFNNVRIKYIRSPILQDITEKEMDTLEEYMWVQIRMMTINKSWDPSPVQKNEDFWRSSLGSHSKETTIVLHLVPLNGTFAHKYITVPTTPGVLNIGRQTSIETMPMPFNGYFAAEILSRQHAEEWATRDDKIWIRDIKSLNGTFINGKRLSPEGGRYSDPYELRTGDMLELGADSVGSDQKSIEYKKVAARVYI